MKPSRREWCDKKATTSVTAFSGVPSGTLPRAKERRTVAFLTALACRRPVRVSPMVHQMIQARHRHAAAYRSARREPADLRPHRPLASRCGNAARGHEIRAAKPAVCAMEQPGAATELAGSLGICREPRTGRKAAICPRDPFEPHSAGAGRAAHRPRGQPSQKT